MIFFEDITAGNLRLAVVLRPQLFDVHPVLASLDFFGEDIHARITLLGELGAGPAREHFHKAGARRVMAHFIAQLIFQGTASSDLEGPAAFKTGGSGQSAAPLRGVYEAGRNGGVAA